MTIKDLIYLSELEQYAVAYQLNITYCYLSEIKNKKISKLSRDLQLKIRLFIIENNLKEKIDDKFKEISESHVLIPRKLNPTKP